MSPLLQALAGKAFACPNDIALIAKEGNLSWLQLYEAVQTLRAWLQARQPRSVALYADNGAFWVIADLACLAEQIPCVPLPQFFSPAQIQHAISDCGADLLLCDHPAPESVPLTVRPKQGQHQTLGDQPFWAFPLLPLRGDTPDLRNTARITYTSGSTGTPKGVRLSLDAMQSVASSLCQATDARAEDRHLSVLPYATLLENIAGIYTPILAGATLLCPGLERVGIGGGNHFDPARLLHTLQELHPSSLILTPQLLRGLVQQLQYTEESLPTSLRFVAVGGAVVAPGLLAEAEGLGLPVYQGYGLSECSSVVTLCTPDQQRRGSVGRPLPHADVRTADDGEILVKGALFQGYVGMDTPLIDADGYWHTGDIGYFDDEGFLYVAGRKRDIFITSFGRNVSPEWVEQQLLEQAPIAQACVLGEGQPFNIAIIVAAPEATPQAITAAIDQANHQLPDYARIGDWVLADAPFTPDNDLLGPSGLPLRDAIQRRYADRITQRYQEAS
jgi:long-subunit acyl-CoA synthetase (AMP-forming)